MDEELLEFSHQSINNYLKKLKAEFFECQEKTLKLLQTSDFRIERCLEKIRECNQFSTNQQKTLLSVEQKVKDNENLLRANSIDVTDCKKLINLTQIQLDKTESKIMSLTTRYINDRLEEVITNIEKLQDKQREHQIKIDGTVEHFAFIGQQIRQAQLQTTKVNEVANQNYKSLGQEIKLMNSQKCDLSELIQLRKDMSHYVVKSDLNIIQDSIIPQIQQKIIKLTENISQVENLHGILKKSIIDWDYKLLLKAQKIDIEEIGTQMNNKISLNKYQFDQQRIEEKINQINKELDHRKEFSEKYLKEQANQYLTTYNETLADWIKEIVNNKFELLSNKLNDSIADELNQKPNVEKVISIAQKAKSIPKSDIEILRIQFIEYQGQLKQLRKFVNDLASYYHKKQSSKIDKIVLEASYAKLSKQINKTEQNQIQVFQESLTCQNTEDIASKFHNQRCKTVLSSSLDMQLSRSNTIRLKQRPHMFKKQSYMNIQFNQ